MRILVCVKHVPKEEDMKLDPVTKTLIRGGEGEIRHNENGINREYESSDIPESMLKYVSPVVKIV